MKHRIVFFFFCMLAGASYAKRTTSIAQMKVEYQKTPIALEEEHPRFSWQMLSESLCHYCNRRAGKGIVELWKSCQFKVLECTLRR